MISQNQPNERSKRIVRRLEDEHGVKLHQPHRVFVRRSAKRGQGFTLDAPGGLREVTIGGIRPITIYSAGTATECACNGFHLLSAGDGNYHMVVKVAR